MPASKSQDIGYWLTVVGGVLIAADIFGPQLMGVERFLNKLAYFTFRSAAERFRRIVVRIFAWLPEKFFSRSEEPGPRTESTYPSEETAPITLANPPRVLLGFILVNLLMMGATLYTMASTLVYLALLLLDIPWWLATVPYRISLWLRATYGWVSPVRILGLLIFVLGAILHYLGSR